MLIRVLTGNIRPCFSRRPDEPSTALHHHLANRDHWHHKETGVDRGPAIIAPGFTPIATTAQREQRRFLTDRGRAPRLAKAGRSSRTSHALKGVHLNHWTCCGQPAGARRGYAPTGPGCCVNTSVRSDRVRRTPRIGLSAQKYQVDFDQNLARRRNQVRIMRSTAVDVARRLEAYDPDWCSFHGPISGVLDLKAASDGAVVVLNDLHPTQLNRCRGAARSNAHFQKEARTRRSEALLLLRAQASAASTSILTRATSNRPGRLTGSSQLRV